MSWLIVAACVLIFISVLVGMEMSSRRKARRRFKPAVVGKGSYPPDPEIDAEVRADIKAGEDYNKKVGIYRKPELRSMPGGKNIRHEVKETAQITPLADEGITLQQALVANEVLNSHTSSSEPHPSHSEPPSSSYDHSSSHDSSHSSYDSGGSYDGGSSDGGGSFGGD